MFFKMAAGGHLGFSKCLILWKNFFHIPFAHNRVMFCQNKLVFDNFLNAWQDNYVFNLYFKDSIWPLAAILNFEFEIGSLDRSFCTKK